jgi:hypothetical protein
MPRTKGREKYELLVNGYRILLLQDGRFWRLGDAQGYKCT